MGLIAGCYPDTSLNIKCTKYGHFISGSGQGITIGALVAICYSDNASHIEKFHPLLRPEPAG